ncbi:MAG TPA: dihydrofolate reductase family protein [Thermomicrobiales bacterium]|nr:dihydrofolate reductase family protein [Thermomicrobiales bacterium]
MRKLVVNTFVSLDGVMQAPGGKGEDPEGGFDLEGWSVNYWDETMNAAMGDFMGKPFDLILGRKTYEIFASFWPNASEAEGAGPLNAATKYVASTTQKNLEWGPSELLGDDVVARIAELKRGDGPELQVHGSANLLQTLIAHDVIDEFRVLIFPVVLGKGKRLFEAGVPPRGYKLVASQVAASGVILTTYHLAGEIELGTFGPDGEPIA